MESPHGTNKRRHVFCDAADTEDTNTDSKRICIAPSLNPAGHDLPFNPNNAWDVQPGAMFPNAQFCQTASEQVNELKSTAVQYIHDEFSPLANSGQHNACDNVYVPKSKTETTQTSQYDACFGVASNLRVASRSKER